MKKKPAKASTSKGKRGGQKNNNNARKHGLYATKPTPTANPLTIEERRNILDGCIRTMFDLFQSLNDIDDMAKCLNSISIAVTAANGCERTLSLVNGTYTPIDEILNALKYLDPSED